jgi:hypothetical protein
MKLGIVSECNKKMFQIATKPPVSGPFILNLYADNQQDILHGIHLDRGCYKSINLLNTGS